MIKIKLYEGINVKNLKSLGHGYQGKVYKIDSQKCIKIFKKNDECMDEVETLFMAQSDAHFPKLYSFGHKYIIREFIDGIELDKYLLNNTLTESISMKIIELYEAMEQVGFTRLDVTLFHIFITPYEEFKLIDTARLMKKKTVYPNLIITELNKLGYKNQFLDYVKNKKPEIYKKWISNINE